MEVIKLMFKRIEERFYDELPLGYAEKAIEIINEELKFILYKLNNS